MTARFAIEAEWMSAESGPDELRETSALTTVRVNDEVATEAEDEWSKSVRTSVRLPLYPLAQWFAASWWRLRWEARPWRQVRPTSWRMSHEAAAAGYGYVWPPLVFVSDGETVEVECTPSRHTSCDSIRYLRSFQEWIPAAAFERSVDEFVELVLTRLNVVGKTDTDLHRLWGEVIHERNNAEMTAFRRLEAQLGYDPDELPENLLQDWLKLSVDAGASAVGEIAASYSGEEPSEALSQIADLARLPGIPGRAALRESLPESSIQSIQQMRWPWERGWQLARLVRTALGQNADTLSDSALKSSLGIATNALDRISAVSGASLSLARRLDGRGQDMAFVLQKRDSHAMRFQLARILAETLIAPETDRWLPMTRARTARQKVQRAFAAELLCPFEQLMEFLDEDFSDEACEQASGHFRVSSVAIKSHLANHHVIPAEMVPLVGYQV